MNRKIGFLGIIASLLILVMFPLPAKAVPVQLELALLTDVSTSVDSTEFNLMKQGYVQAFQNPTIQNKIATLPGGIAVTFIYWSSQDRQQQAVSWTRITSAAEANAFAAAINATTRPWTGTNYTAIGNAINFAYPLFANNGYEGTFNFIDVSGDGSRNQGLYPENVRPTALAALGTYGAINGLPIVNEESNLASYYTTNVIGGYEAFIVTAANYSAFSTSIQKKLSTELENAAVPLPASVLLLGSGLMGMGLLGWRRRVRS